MGSLVVMHQGYVKTQTLQSLYQHNHNHLVTWSSSVKALLTLKRYEYSPSKGSFLVDKSEKILELSIKSKGVLDSLGDTRKIPISIFNIL
jgi:hypothetical protein